MRKRPELTPEEKKFIEGATANKADQSTVKEDMHKYVRRMLEPIDHYKPNPSMAQGSPLRKDLTTSLTEIQWNTLDRHVKAIGAQKAEWVRHAIFKLIEEEQLYCFKNRSLHG